MGWGAYVLTMDVPLSALPAYDVLSQYVPGGAWGALAALLGVTQVAAAIYEVRVLRWIMAWLGLLLWKVMGVSLFNSGEIAPAGMVYCVLAIFNIPTIVLLRPRPRLPLR